MPMLKKLPSEFVPAFRYKVSEGAATEVEVLNENLWRERGIVYARVVDELVVYIGSTDHSLRKRITAHVSGLEHVRNERYRRWAEGKAIVIFACKAPLVPVLNRKIAIHRSLEAALINEARSRRTKAREIEGQPIAWFVKRA